MKYNWINEKKQQQKYDAEKQKRMMPKNKEITLLLLIWRKGTENPVFLFTTSKLHHSNCHSRFIFCIGSLKCFGVWSITSKPSIQSTFSIFNDKSVWIPRTTFLSFPTTYKRHLFMMWWQSSPSPANKSLVLNLMRLASVDNMHTAQRHPPYTHIHTQIIINNTESVMV